VTKPIMCNNCGLPMVADSNVAFMAILDRPVSGPATANPCIVWVCACGNTLAQMVRQGRTMTNEAPGGGNLRGLWWADTNRIA